MRAGARLVAAFLGWSSFWEAFAAGFFGSSPRLFCKACIKSITGARFFGSLAFDGLAFALGLDHLQQALLIFVVILGWIEIGSEPFDQLFGQCDFLRLDGDLSV